MTPNYRKKGLHHWYSEEALHQSFISLWSRAALTPFLVVMLPSSLSPVVWARLNLDKLKTKATKACVSMSKAEINSWHLTSASLCYWAENNILAVIKNKQALLMVPVLSWDVNCFSFFCLLHGITIQFSLILESAFTFFLVLEKVSHSAASWWGSSIHFERVDLRSNRTN